MQIFAGSGSQRLGYEIANLMGQDLSRVELGKFSNGESRIRILEEKIEREVVIVQSLSAPADERLMELALMTDALTRMGATEITAVVPWLSYSKQDKVFLSGEALGAKVVAKLLESSGIKKLVTFDLHNRAILGFFNIPVVELSAKPLLINYFYKDLRAETLVAAPDAGAVKGATAFAQELGVETVYIDKRRDLVSGEVRIVGMSRGVDGKDIVVVDDNVFTGSTLIEMARYLRKEGARSIKVGLTHHMYIPGVQEKIEDSEVDEIVVTDTVAGEAVGKLKVLSVAGLIAQELTKHQK